MYKFYKIMLVAIFFNAYIASASAGSLTASVKQPQVSQGEAVNLQIVYEGEDGNLLQPDLSVLQSDFTIYSTSNSLQTSFINGVSHQIREWQIGLMPKKNGVINIPEITVGKYKTAPLQVEILAAGTISNTKQTETSAAGVSSGVPQTANFAAYLSADNQTPYVQQQVNAVLTIEDNRGLQLTEEPAFISNDDWIIKVLRQPTVEDQQGKRVIKFYYAMFPQKSGGVEIPPLQIKGYYMAYDGSDDLQQIGGFFHLFDMDINSIFGVQKPVMLQTNPQTLQVKPAPEEFKKQWLPATALSATAKWSDNKPMFKVGETVAREITITAAGIADTQLPEIEFNDNPLWKQYPENPQVTSVVHDDEIISQEIIRVVYIPQQGGAHVLPEIRIPWFNVKTGKIETAVIPEEEIMVSGSAAVPPKTSVSGVMPQQASQLITNHPLTEDKQQSTTGWWQYGALIIAFAAGIVVSLFLRRSAPHTRENSLHYSIAEIADSLKNKDYRHLQESLLQWGRIAFPNKSIINLNDLSQAVNEPLFAQQMENLNAILYADKKENLDEKAILDCVKKYKAAVKVKEQKLPLPKLYK